MTKIDHKYRKILQGFGDLIFLIDAEGIFRDYVAQHSDSFPLDPEKCLGQPIQAVLPPEFAKQLLTAMDILRGKNGISETLEYQSSFPDGRIRYLQARIAAALDETFWMLIYDITERKQAVEALKSSEEKYSKFFHTSNDGIIIHDLNGKILDINQQILSWLDYSREEILSIPVYQLHSPTDLAIVQCALEVIRKEGVVNFEVSFLRKDGSSFWTEVSSSIFELAGQKVVQGIIRDITERKKAEKALKESEARKTAIMESALDCIVVSNDKGEILEFNPAAEKTFQHNREDIIGQKLNTTLIPERFRSAHLQGMASYLDTGEPRVLGKRVELPALRADGVEIPVELAITPLQLGEETIFTAYLRDISERIASENKLKQEKERLDIILHNIGNGVVALNANFEIILINERAKKLFNFPVQNAIGIRIESLLKNCCDRKNQLLEALSLEHFQKLELSTVFPDAKTLQITGTTFLDVDEKSAGKILIIADMTQEKEIDRLRTDFVSNVSHELRTPLSSIMGFSGTILRDKRMDDGTKMEFVRIIQEESKRLGRLIENVLSISRIESGRSAFNFAMLKTASLISDMVEHYQKQARNNDIHLDSDIAIDLPPVLADKSSLKQITMNLVSNAIKFNNPGGTVKVTLNMQEKHLILEVQDNGMGIPSKDLDKIFDKFYKVHRPEIQTKGTGLGLSIVKMLVDAHKGTIEVESQEDKGSLFRIMLPAVTEFELST